MSKAPEFSYTPEQIENIAVTAINELNLEIEKIVGIPKSRRSFENTVLAFELACAKLTEITQVPQFLAIVSEDSAVRSAGEALRLKIGQNTIDLMTREDVFNALKEYAEKDEELGPVDARLLKKQLKEFERGGLGLEPRKKERVKIILKELVALSLEFQKNLRDVSDVLEVTETELKGLPDDYRSRLKRTAKGGYLVTMNYPDYNPFMENAESDKARRCLYQIFNNRCAGTNVKLLEKSITLRREVAKLLGYDSYADYVLNDRMAKSSETVFAFLERTKAKLTIKARKELGALLELKGNGEKALNAWEIPYYTNLLRKTKFSIDHQKIREYFPLETVLKGLFGVFGELFGVEFVPKPLPTWHKDVRAYEVRSADGALEAYFYLDLFPRDGKFKHACCSSIMPGREADSSGENLPAAAVVSNFSAPAGGLPVLLKFSEVETLLHEFGHVTQAIFCRAKYSALSGFNVPLDYVEVPSMLLQQWAYEPAMLRRISGHYKNVEQKLPDEIIARLIAAKNMCSGLASLRLLALSAIDMRYHTAGPKVDTGKLYEQLMKKIFVVPMVEGTHPQASLIHLMPGYAAGLYSYIWAEVIAADIFGVFQEAGTMNQDIGRRYREIILRPGATMDEAGQVEKFLGRKFSEAAYFRKMDVGGAKGPI